MIPARSSFYLALACQLLVLVGMVIDRQMLLAGGTEIRLRTRPVDPRSLLSGDYVNLQLEISQVPFRDEGKPETLLAGSRAYVSIEPGPDGFWRATGVFDERPGTGVFLRGQVSHGGFPQGGQRTLSIVYGLESWYVKEGTGKALERLPYLEVRARVSGSGASALTGVTQPGGS